MSLVWNWFWSNKKVDESEKKQEVERQRQLFSEMKRYFVEKEVTRRAERKFDFDQVYETFCDNASRLVQTENGLTWDNDVIIYKNEEERKRVREAIVRYFDFVVSNKEFFLISFPLKQLILLKLLTHPKREDVTLDWHYWQLFQRDIHADLQNTSEAMAIILKDENMALNDDEFSSSSEEEYYYHA